MVIGGHLSRNRALTALLVLEGLSLFVAAPLAGMGFQAPVLIGALLGGPLIFTIVIISTNTPARLLAMLAAILAISGAAFRIHHPGPVSFWLGHSASIVAMCGMSLVIGQAVFAAGRITHHRIEGAVILYLNIAVIFTSAYRLINELDPGSFANLPPNQTEAAAISSLLYFSFTTLTSTGFGDIFPIHPFARSLANLEAVLGQLYLTVLLGRLVTMHIGSHRG